MDFRSLLSLAKDNQSYNQKKLVRDKLLKEKDKKHQVSDSAVQEFLAKKQKEAKTKKDMEIAERQKRIMAKVEGTDKKGTGKPSSTTNHSTVKTHLQKKRQGTEPQKTSSSHKMGAKKSDKIPNSGAVATNKDEKATGRKISRAQPENRPDKDRRTDRMGKPPPKDRVGHHKNKDSRHNTVSAMKQSSAASQKPSSNKKGSSATSGLSFNELMQVAQKQANKPVPLPTKKKDTKDVSDMQIEVSSTGTKHLKKEKYEMNSQISNSKKRIDVGNRKSGKQPLNKQVQPSKSERSKLHHETSNLKQEKCKLVTRTIGNYDPLETAVYKGPLLQAKQIARRPTQLPCRKRLHDIDAELERERRELEKKRMMFRSKYGDEPVQSRYGGYDNYDDYDDYEDEDDMDDFIDDSEAGLDVSNEIRKIFGYDRRRYADDDDDDLSTMETSYSQIEKEEARSARIAKLEDDIERLKEIKEMQKRKKN